MVSRLNKRRSNSSFLLSILDDIERSQSVGSKSANVGTLWETHCIFVYKVRKSVQIVQIVCTEVVSEFTAVQDGKENTSGIKPVYSYDIWIEMFTCFQIKIGLLSFSAGVSNFHSINNKSLMKMNTLVIKKSNIFGTTKFYIVTNCFF